MPKSESNLLNRWNDGAIITVIVFPFAIGHHLLPDPCVPFLATASSSRRHDHGRGYDFIEAYLLVDTHLPGRDHGAVVVTSL